LAIRVELTIPKIVCRTGFLRKGVLFIVTNEIEMKKIKTKNPRLIHPKMDRILDFFFF
jgi:hypothetical protein